MRTHLARFAPNSAAVGFTILILAALSVFAHAGDQPQKNLLTSSCAQAAADSPCTSSKSDLKKAKAAFAKGLKLQSTNLTDQAYQQFDAAAHLVPQNLEYVTALAVAREQLVFRHLQAGNQELLDGKQVEAQADFRNAVNLDPQNEFAQQRLRDSVSEWSPRITSPPRVIAEETELHLSPAPGLHEFHFRGDSRDLLTQVAEAFGIKAEFDDSVASRRVHFDIENVDFETAIAAACQVTATFWTTSSDKQILLAKDTPENHRQFDHLAMRKVYVPGISSTNGLGEMVNMLRTVFEIRFVQQVPNTQVMVMRAPLPVLDAATQFLMSFSDSRPQVMLDIEVFEVDHQLARNMGLHIPNNFNLFLIPAAALAALGGQNIQSLINQLISSGGINQANSSAISALLAQIGGQQQNSIFSQPLATFGGGLTLMGLSLDSLAAQLSVNESWVRSISHASLRVSQGNDTSFKLGQRYPILNASFAPVFNTSAISQVLQNGSFQAPFPSFSYEDLGLSVKAKPAVYANSDINLQLEMQIRALAGQSINGVPVLANREYKGSITLVDGEPAVLAGSVTHSEQLSLSGLPGLGAIPGLNKIVTTNGKTTEDDELLIMITPHIMSLSQNANAETWLPKQ